MDPKPKCEMQKYKVTKRKHRKSFCDLVLDRDFLDMTLKAQSIIWKSSDKLDSIKIKNCSVKYTVTKIRQATNEEKFIWK